MRIHGARHVVYSVVWRQTCNDTLKVDKPCLHGVVPHKYTITQYTNPQRLPPSFVRRDK